MQTSPTLLFHRTYNYPAVLPQTVPHQRTISGPRTTSHNERGCLYVGPTQQEIILCNAMQSLGLLQLRKQETVCRSRRHVTRIARCFNHTKLLTRVFMFQKSSACSCDYALAGTATLSLLLLLLFSFFSSSSSSFFFSSSFSSSSSPFSSSSSSSPPPPPYPSSSSSSSPPPPPPSSSSPPPPSSPLPPPHSSSSSSSSSYSSSRYSKFL